MLAHELTELIFRKVGVISQMSTSKFNGFTAGTLLTASGKEGGGGDISKMLQ